MLVSESHGAPSRDLEPLIAGITPLQLATGTNLLERPAGETRAWMPRLLLWLAGIFC